MASHPVYQYLQVRYGLALKSLHWEPDVLPTPEAWRALKATLKSHPAKFMLWEAAPLPAAIQQLGDLGVTSLVYDPCARTPREGDFMARMRKNVEALRLAWQ